MIYRNEPTLHTGWKRLAAFIVILAPMTAWEAAADDSALEVTAPPSEMGFDEFYAKYVSVDGFPVISSARVNDAALREAAWIIRHMLATRPDIRQALIDSHTRCTVMAVDEFTTMVPEHSDLKPSKYWDRRARGLGATPERPCVSCGEENLLRYPGDPYRTESILVHEFAHAIHDMGLNQIEEDFDSRLKSIYDKAMSDGLWEGKYAATNHHEYWAEGVQSYFDTNRPPDHDHNYVDTREELAEYDPRLFALIDETFRQNAWRYTRPDQRHGEGRRHLAGYDPDSAPTFAWPAGLEEWYREYQAGRQAGGQ
jgi:hypothetical protein